MKRILDNDSSNSSIPPSKNQPGKAPNTFNGRKPTRKKPGARLGHKGSGLSKMKVVQKNRDGICQHRTEQLGTPGRAYITWYRLDVTPIATEIRIYADHDGKFQVPDDLRADVSYGGTVKAIQSCSTVRTRIEQELLNSDVIYTDATPVKTDGKQTNIRNFSTETCALYCNS